MGRPGAGPAVRPVASRSKQEPSGRGGTIQACTALNRSTRLDDVMAGRSVANRSETVTVPASGGSVEVVRRQWRSERPVRPWNSEWLARRVGQRDRRQRSTAGETIRKAVLLASGKRPKWLLDTADRASAELEDCDRQGTPGELCAAPAVPAADARRRGGHGGRRRRAPWPVSRQRECGPRGRGGCSSSPVRSACTRATGSRSLVGVGSGPALRTPSSARWHRCRRRAGGCGTRCRGRAGETSTRWRSRRPGSRSRSRRSAPRGALLYPRLSREELEGRFLGPMAYPDLKGERDSSMPLKRWSAEASGLGCRGTRVIWRKLDCLNPNLQTMQRSVCRKDACDRHHALRRFFSLAVATFGVWSVAQ